MALCRLLQAYRAEERRIFKPAVSAHHGNGAILLANLIGAILGLASLGKSIRNKWMAVTGIIVNGCEIAGVILLMVIGVALNS